MQTIKDTIVLSGLGPFEETTSELEELKACAQAYGCSLRYGLYSYSILGERSNVEIVTVQMWNMTQDQWGENGLYVDEQCNFLEKYARFTVFDGDCWEVYDTRTGNMLDDGFLVVYNQPFDYHGNFTAIPYAPLPNGSHLTYAHCAASPEYLSEQKLASEDEARQYIRITCDYYAECDKGNRDLWESATIHDRRDWR